MANPLHITVNDLGYGASVIKPFYDSSEGWVGDEKFFQGDDYHTLMADLEEIEEAWDRGDMKHLFKNVKQAKDSYLDNYFIS